VSSEFQDNLLLWNRVTTSAELAQYWQEEDVMHLHTHTAKQRHLDNGLVSRPETTSLSGEEKVMPTVKHPEHPCVVSLTILPKNIKKRMVSKCPARAASPNSPGAICHHVTRRE